ncbi:hypothetical protein MMC22_005640 [Lobaria immixta]|nr:hypothetical protein [Lobaria immixta]
MEPATSEQHLHPPQSGLELDPFYPGLELNRNFSGLEPISADDGLESTAAENFERNAPQLRIGTENKGVQRENPAGLIVQEPKGYPPRKKSSHRLAVALILFVIMVAIAVPVSVTQTRNSSRTTPGRAPSPTLSSSVSSPTPSSSRPNGNDSTSGAFKGTGLVTISSQDNSKSSYLFFQHYSGQIRQLVSHNMNAWTGGSNSDVIVGSNARNGTPLTVGSYIEDKILWSHLFYIDTSNFLQDLVRSNESDEWQKGTLGELQIATSESATVGLYASPTRFESNIDMLLYYGTKDNLVQELTYSSTNQSWQSGFSFAKSNGNSGIQLVYHPEVASIHLLLLLNSDYHLELWWKDSNETSVASPAHPVGEWTRHMVATNATVSHSSSLGMINAGRLLYQDPSNQIIEIEIIVAGPETSGFKYHESSQDGSNALAAEPNTRIASYAFVTIENTERVFYLQTNGSNIVEYRYDSHEYTLYTTRVIYA